MINAPTLIKLSQNKNFVSAIRETYPQLKSATDVWINDPKLLSNATSCPTAAVEGSAVYFQKKDCNGQSLYGICFGGPIPDQ
jgi:hypothetical protein